MWTSDVRLHSGVGGRAGQVLGFSSSWTWQANLLSYWAGFHIEIREERTTRNTFILAVHHQDESNYLETELKLMRVQTNKLTSISCPGSGRVSRAGEMPAGGENFLDWSPQEAYCYHILPRNVGVISHIILDMHGEVR